MSDFVPRDLLPDLWAEILQRHWTYVETEESLQKIEEKKKLEGCIKELLCIVSHDHKFYLPETAQVLRRSVTQMDDFSAYKASVGFESISQYANNLFTKPWRKEYRVIKMYSGFFQHEIKSNLLDAEQLFVAMGYKIMPNQTLVLEVPICPDQVSNVARDSMAANVECQIMKQIYSGLTSMQVTCSWAQIFNFREFHIGGVSQAIKSMIYQIQEKRFRKDKIIAQENCYNLVSPYNPCTMHPTTAAYCPVPAQSYNAACLMHQNAPAASMYQPTSVDGPLYGVTYAAAAAGNLPHSKSLDHYVDHNSMNAASHRHSFDNPYDCVQRQHPYDCVDGRTQPPPPQPPCNNYNTCTHPYNVSGNRYPLPYNLSAHLNGAPFVGNPNPMCNGHCRPPLLVQNCCKPMVDSSGGGVWYPTPKMHSDCSGGYKKQPPEMNYHNGHGGSNYMNNNGAPINNNNNIHQQQLIDFDERLPTVLGGSIESGVNQIYDRHKIVSDRVALENAMHTTRPAPKPAKVSSHEIASELMQTRSLKRSDNHKASRLAEFDSMDEALADSPHSRLRSANKNQDGVGSFESWDYVFQNLEKQGYSKDLGERGDLLVQGLDLDSLALAPVDKRKSAGNGMATGGPGKIRNAVADPTPVESVRRLAASSTTKVQKISPPVHRRSGENARNNGKPTASSTTAGGDKKTMRRSRVADQSTVSEAVVVPPTEQTPHSHAIISSKEWSCRFCTYLNSDAKRICEMCSKSRDFNLEAANLNCVS